MLKKLIQCRVSEEDYGKYLDKVKQSGYTQSEFFRELIVKNKTAIVDKSFSNHLIRQLAWIGNNLNQITHTLNKDMLMNQYIDLATLRDLKGVLLSTRNEMLSLKSLSINRLDRKQK